MIPVRILLVVLMLSIAIAAHVNTPSKVAAVVFLLLVFHMTLRKA